MSRSRRRSATVPTQGAKVALVYAPSAVGQHGSFMHIGVVAVSCTSQTWDSIRLFRVALQRTFGLNDCNFRRVKDDQFVITLRPHVLSIGRLQEMATTIASLVTKYLGIRFIRHKLFPTQAEVEAILA